MIPVDPTAPTRFIVEDERKDDSPSVFVLKPVCRKEELELLRLAQDGRKADNYSVLRIVLTGWENFDAPFETDEDGRPTMETLDRIPFAYRAEIAAAALGSARLTADDRKN